MSQEVQEVNVIKEVIERVLENQPMTVEEFRDRMRNELMSRLHKNINNVLYIPGEGREEQIRLDGGVIVVRNVDEDLLVIEDDNIVMFDVYVEGKVVEICMERCVEVMMNYKLKEVKEVKRI